MSGTPPFVILLLGPPGCGKDSQADIIARHYGFLREVPPDSPPTEGWDPAALIMNMVTTTLQVTIQEGHIGVVFDSVTPDLVPSVLAACTQFGLTINCYIHFDLDNLVTMVTNVLSHEACNPHNVLAAIYDYMFGEPEMLAHFSQNPNFFSVDGTVPRLDLSLRLLEIIDSIRPIQSISTTSVSEDINGYNYNVTPFAPTCPPYLRFVESKTAALSILGHMQALLGLNSRCLFPGQQPSILDEGSLLRVCSMQGHYTASKHSNGIPALLLHLANDPKCYIIEPSLAVYVGDCVPSLAQMEDILVEGELVDYNGSLGCFVATDALYLSGCLSTHKPLDERMGPLMKYFPSDGKMNSMVVTQLPGSISLVCRTYFVMQEIPKLVSQVASDQPIGSFYPSHSLRFTPKAEPYRVGVSRVMYQWRPGEKPMSVDLRLLEVEGNKFQLYSGHIINGMQREVSLDVVDPALQKPAFHDLHSMSGKVVRCILIKPHLWQLTELRLYKPSPDLYETVVGLQQSLPSWRVVQAHISSAPSPTVYTPPWSQPQHGRFPAQYVASPSSSTISSGPFPYGPLQTVVIPHPQVHVTYPQPHADADYIRDEAVVYVQTQQSNKQNTSPETHNIISDSAVVYVKSSPTQSTPVKLKTSNSSSNVWAPDGGTPWKDYGSTAENSNNNSPNYEWKTGHSLRVSQVEGDHQIEDVGELIKAVTDNDIPDLDITSPLSSSCSSINSSGLSKRVNAPTPLTSSLVEHDPGSRKVSPESTDSSVLADDRFTKTYRQTLGSDSSGSTKRSSMSPFAGSPLRSPTWGNTASPAVWASSPSKQLVRRAFRDFNNFAKMWMIQEFSPPKSFSVLDLCCRRGNDIHKWDRANASHLVGCDTDPTMIQEANNRIKAKRSSELNAIFVVADCFSDDFALPDTCPQVFDVVSCMFAIQNAFSSEESARKLFQVVSKSLHPGGIFMGTTIDGPALIERISGSLECGNSEYRITFDNDPSKVTEMNPFGHKYKFKMTGTGEEWSEYLVLPEALTRLARESGFQKTESGHKNFGPVAEEISRLSSKGREVWNGMSDDERQLVKLYTTFVFVKD